MVKISFKQKIQQSQKSYLSLESKLFIKLIKLNIDEINDLLEKELGDNPCLEEIPDQEVVFEKNTTYQSEEFNNESLIQYEENNITHYLIKQINHLNITEKEKRILASLAYLLDEKGFLAYSNKEIILILKKQEDLNILEIDFEELILRAQRLLDPPGILARDIKESIKIQLELSNNQDFKEFSKIIDLHLNELANKDFKTISKSLNLHPSKIRKCLEDLSELNMEPANIFYSTKQSTKSPEPEAYVLLQNNKLIIQSNKKIKKIKVSHYYKKMLSHKGKLEKDVKDYLKEKINSGSLLIKTIMEREEMYKQVFNSLVEVQKDYLIKGERHLKPLKLSDISTKLDVHESTISRITSNKYISTPRGMINMKSLFNNKASASSDESSAAVRDIIREMVEKENKNSPLTDDEIRNNLVNKKILIARRTIAKYRNILRIPSSNKRRKQ
jgi:RNA polymerase sigma-54 factor